VRLAADKTGSQCVDQSGESSVSVQLSQELHIVSVQLSQELHIHGGLMSMQLAQELHRYGGFNEVQRSHLIPRRKAESQPLQV